MDSPGERGQDPSGGRPSTEEVPAFAPGPRENPGPPSDTPIVLTPGPAGRESDLLVSGPDWGEEGRPPIHRADLILSEDDTHPRLPPAAAFPQPGERLADFQLVRRLGGGGMGTVFLGRHHELGVERAIKVMLMGGHDLARRQERFRREAQALARADQHPNLVRVHAYGTIPERAGLAYCVLDLVEGPDLFAALEAGPLPMERVLRIGAGIARGLAHLHRAGIVHRDLKPANVLLGADGVPRLTDLGLALATGEERLTRTGQVVGTLNYMAPEQARGDRELGPAADVFALGCLLYEMLVGDLAFPGFTAEVMLSIVRHDVPAPSSQRAGLPSDLDALVGACLAKDPAARPSAEAAAEALEALNRGEPVGSFGAGGSRLRRLARPLVAIPLGLWLAGTAAGVLMATRDAGPSLAEVRRDLDAAWRELPAGESGPAAARLRELERRSAAEPTPETRALRARAGLLWAQLAWAAGEREAALAELRGMEELLAGPALDPGGVRALDREADALRGLVALAQGDAGEALAALRRARALRRRRGWPARADLTRAFLEAALAAGRPGLAAQALDASGDTSPGSPAAGIDGALRLRVLVAADRLSEALRVEGPLPPAARAPLLYRLGAASLLRGDVAAASSWTLAAVAADPQLPARAELAVRARRLAAERADWPQTNSPAALLEPARRELAAHRLVRLLDPDHRLPAERRNACLDVGDTRGLAPEELPQVFPLARDLVELAPDWAPAHRLLMMVALSRGEPLAPELRAGVLQRIRTGPLDTETRRLAFWAGAALVRAKDAATLDAIIAEVARGTATELMVDLLVFRALMALEREELPEALALLDRAATAAPAAPAPDLVRHLIHRRNRRTEEARRAGWAVLARAEEVAFAGNPVLTAIYTQARLPQWLAQQEEARGDPAAAARAIGHLLEAQPSAVYWALHRVVLLARSPQPDEAAILADLAQLPDRMRLRAHATSDGGLARTFRAVDHTELRELAERGRFALLAERLARLEELLRPE